MVRIIRLTIRTIFFVVVVDGLFSKRDNIIIIHEHSTNSNETFVTAFYVCENETFEGEYNKWN